MSAAKQSEVAIVTDSTADISPDLAQQHNIHIIANIMVIDGREVRDGIGITREEFYKRLPEMKQSPTTATASSGEYQALYESLFQQGFQNILSIHPSSLLSGIINAATSAAEQFDSRVQVFDSDQISLGLGFQVLEAAEAASAGEPLEAVRRRAEAARPRARVMAMLDTLEFVRRSGRVSWAKARLGNLLNVKPFIEVRNGQVFSLGEARTRGKGLERLRQLVYSLGPLERLAILHSIAEEEARLFLNSLNIDLPTQPLIVNITSVIGTHVGPKCLGVAALIK